MQDLIERGFNVMGVAPAKALPPVVVKREKIPTRKTPQIASTRKIPTAVKIRGRGEETLTISNDTALRLADFQDENNWGIQVGAFLKKQEADAQMGETIAFVPTMGALHEGHMTLIKLAKKKADRVVVSIYVNPTQFAPGEDFEAYPRTEKNDVAMLQAEGADLVYIPLDMPIKIVGAKIARDEHGLALSSRNKYFDEEGLKVARRLNEIMRFCALQMSKGENVDLATDRAAKALLTSGFSSVDYVEVRSPNSLTVLEGGALNGPARLLVAAHCKGVRLIDNFPVKVQA